MYSSDAPDNSEEPRNKLLSYLRDYVDKNLLDGDPLTRLDKLRDLTMCLLGGFGSKRTLGHEYDANGHYTVIQRKIMQTTSSDTEQKVVLTLFTGEMMDRMKTRLENQYLHDELAGAA